MDSLKDDIVHLKILDICGNEFQYDCTSLTNLRKQIASQQFDTYTPCIALIDENGYFVVDEDWEYYSNLSTLTTFIAINDTTFIDKMIRWTPIQWQRTLYRYLKLEDWSIIDALNNLVSKESSDRIKGSVLEIFCRISPRKNIIQKLLEHDAHILEQHAVEALNCACCNGYKEIVSILVEYGVDIKKHTIVHDYPSHFITLGGQALLKAATSGHSDIITMLVGYGVDISNEYGGQALRAASYLGQKNVISLLIEKYHVDPTGTYGGQALVRAANEGYSDIVAMLISYGVEVNGEFGGDALVCAARKGKIKTVRTLLDHGIDVNGIYGKEAVQLASSNGHDAIVTLLQKRLSEVSEARTLSTAATLHDSLSISEIEIDTH